jgi:hypothetical protein
MIDPDRLYTGNQEASNPRPRLIAYSWRALDGRLYNVIEAWKIVLQIFNYIVTLI